MLVMEAQERGAARRIVAILRDASLILEEASDWFIQSDAVPAFIRYGARARLSDSRDWAAIYANQLEELVNEAEKCVAHEKEAAK